MTVDKKKKIGLIIATGALVNLLTGCSKEIVDDYSDKDLISTNINIENSDFAKKTIEQKLDVNGEEFKVVLNFTKDDDNWRITTDKTLNYEIKTEGLNENKEVYIDNIHMDTSIVSTKAAYNGIIQDNMDDRIHNTLMLGIPVSDTNTFYGINIIEGKNEEFKDAYGRQITESNILADGIYANKIDIVIDLLIKDKTTEEIRCVSVKTTLLVEANNEITIEENGKTYIKTYNRDGSYKKNRE
ncbi:MAG: hypothetical protein IKJ43_00785 [Bacilli bacterium]|nr:hypothetical protein [Bacilli bacterium]